MCKKSSNKERIQYGKQIIKTGKLVSNEKFMQKKCAQYLKGRF